MHPVIGGKDTSELRLTVKKFIDPQGSGLSGLFPVVSTSTVFLLLLASVTAIFVTFLYFIQGRCFQLCYALFCLSRSLLYLPIEGLLCEIIMHSSLYLRNFRYFCIQFTCSLRMKLVRPFTLHQQTWQ
jgi:hypothetical protein